MNMRCETPKIIRYYTIYYTFPVQYCEHTHYSFQNVESSLLFAVETQRRLTNRASFALECSLSLCLVLAHVETARCLARGGAAGGGSRFAFHYSAPWAREKRGNDQLFHSFNPSATSQTPPHTTPPFIHVGRLVSSARNQAPAVRQS